MVSSSGSGIGGGGVLGQGCCVVLLFNWGMVDGRLVFVCGEVGNGCVLSGAIVSVSDSKTIIDRIIDASRLRLRLRLQLLLSASIANR